MSHTRVQDRQTKEFLRKFPLSSKTRIERLLEGFPTEADVIRLEAERQGDPKLIDPEELMSRPTPGKLRTGRKEVDPEIQKLTKTVMQAAGGKPLKVSITEQRRQQEIVERFVMQFRERQLLQGSEGESPVQATAKENVSAATSSSDASTKPDSNPVTTEDLAGIQKSIEKLSSDLAQVSK